jgi:hypothetical protein
VEENPELVEELIELDLFNIVSVTELTTQFVGLAIISIVFCGLVGISISKIINVMKG